MGAWVLANSIFFSVVEQSLISLDGSKAVPLSIREVLLLDALLKNETDKRRLMSIVWPNTVVSDSSYHKLLFELRANLQLMGLPPTIIKTIPRRGCVINIVAASVDEAELKNLMYSDDLMMSADISGKKTDVVCFPLEVEAEGANLSKTGSLHSEGLNVDSPRNSNLLYFNDFIYKRKNIALVSVISVVLSFFVYSITVSHGDISKYRFISVSNEGRHLFALNKAAAVWDSNILNNFFEIGFHYLDSTGSVYYLCDKDFNKCENYSFSLH